MNTDLRVVDERHLRTDGGPTDIAGKSAMSGSSEINPNCQVVYQELKLRRKYRYIIYKIGEEDINVEHTGATAESFEDFKSKLPFTECRYTHLLIHSLAHLLIYSRRYCVFDQDVTTKDGRKTSKLWFISWIPVNAITYMKMAYTQAKVKFRESLPGVFDCNPTNINELESALGVKEEEEEDNDFDD